MDDYSLQVDKMLEATRIYVSGILPSEWYEQNMIMPPGSAFPGRFNYDLTPYWREPVNCGAKDHPARKIAIVKGAQTGCSASVLTPFIGYTISQNPGNILYLVGNDNLVGPSVIKLDHMIFNCGIKDLIGPSIPKVKNARTGDTARAKEFPGGSLFAASATNHKVLMQLDIMAGIADDFEAVPNSSTTDGDSRYLIEQRFAAYENKMKLFYVSTPRRASLSNIWPAFLRGDQRYFNVPCPCCGHKGDYITYKWTTPSLKTPGKMAGIYWDYDKNGELIDESVGYICQLCDELFTDSYKYEMNLKGLWIPTAKPKEPGFYSYHLNSLYAPPGMKSWTSYVRQCIEANPRGGRRKERQHQTFVNLCEGLCYEPLGKELKATELMKNTRPYKAGEVPEDLSKLDGNGEIVMLTCAIDLNGIYGKENKADDVRLDYEVLAWAESGSTYSVTHGSIGTFIFRETEEEKKIPREKWTYNHTKQNNVWRELDKVLSNLYPVSGTTRKMKIIITAMDTGYCEKEAYEYIDKNHFLIVGVKGNPENKMKPLDRETRNFKEGHSRSNLFIIDGHNVKENLSAMMHMSWDKRTNECQPTGFMNYPTDEVLYKYDNYFSHYEAEHKIEDEDKDGQIKGFVWKKKNTTVQNHFFDCRVYNIAATEIFMDKIFKELKEKHYTWSKFVQISMGKK